MGKPTKVPTLPEHIHKACRDLQVIRFRLPTLLGILDEFKAMMVGEEEDGLPIANNVVLQMVQDSSDMLVIDLASLCTGALAHGGGLFRRFPTHLQFFQGSLRATTMTVPQLNDKHRNAARARLFPGSTNRPVTAADLKKLQKSFSDATSKVRQDRNNTRAHRYEVRDLDYIKKTEVIERYHLKPKEVSDTVDWLLNFFADLHHVVVGAPFLFNISVSIGGVPPSTALDLADLIVHGGITEACAQYGLKPAQADAAHEDAWYWGKRKAYFKAKAEAPKVGQP